MSAIMAKRILPLLPLLLLASAGIAASPAAGPATLVQVAPVVVSTRAIPVRVPGVVARRTEAQLSFKVGGVVRDVAVRAGDTVTAGQVLACLDLAEIDAQLAQARSGVEKARRDRARAVELHERAVVSTELAQDATTGLEQAEASLRIAEFNRLHAMVTAPAAGRVLRRQVEPNEMVGPGQVAVLFASDDEGWIARAGVPDREAARLRVGDSATVLGAGQQPLPGRIVQISEAADSATRTTEVEVRLEGAPPALRSGSVVDLELQPGDVPGRAVVPATSLVEGEGRTAHVFIAAVDGHTVHRQKVTVQTLHDGQAFLETELPPEARVVVIGAEFLREGVAIEIAP
jgi:RND family efflux transporter MFP subunit